MSKNKKKSNDEKTNKEKSNALVRSELKKKYGDVLVPLSESQNNIRTVSTGSLSLDLALGRGGFALGRIYEIFGPNSSGKSTLGVHVVIQAQRRGLKCAYVDAEQAVDPKLFINYGVDAEKLDLVQVYGGENNLSIVETLIQTGDYSVIVIDSVSALIPTVEAEADMADQQMALQARLMSKALRKITPQAAANSVALIFVNQTRMKVGGYGNPETTTGGEALAFWATGRISVRGPESKARRLSDKDGIVYGHKAIHEVIKNKLGEPFRKAELNLIYGKGYDYYNEVLDLAVSLDIIEKSGSWFKYGGNNIAQGAENSVDFLRSNEDIFNTVRDEIITSVGLKEQYELHSNPGPIYS
jgi:recombination protein RecA